MIIPLTLCLSAYAGDLSESETSYTGASILQGDWEATFTDYFDISERDDTSPYAFFEGNTLYVGNSDDYGNTVDGIIEFFWFQSSIDRGTDFYVAVIKTRATPGHDCYYAPWDWARGAQCKLWADEWTDWGEYPVLTVEAMTDIEREQGAFRWDWSIPFESYGIDAYGQVTFQSIYGIGSTSEGAAMAHGEYQLNEDGDMKAEGNVQVRGYHSSEYSVQTQYEVTLYEWDVFVDGRADLMAWDMYLNLGARETQSAYHEYFLSIQVEEGMPFMIDTLNFVSNFDIGWYDPTNYELGIGLQNIEILQPLWETASDDENEDTGQNDTGDIEWTEPGESDNSDESLENNIDADTRKDVSRCNTIPINNIWLFIIGMPIALMRRR